MQAWLSSELRFGLRASAFFRASAFGLRLWRSSPPALPSAPLLHPEARLGPPVLSSGHQPERRPGAAAHRRAGQLRRRRHLRRHGTGTLHDCRPAARPLQAGRSCAARRRQDGAAGHLRWPHAHGAGHHLRLRHAAADQFQARRDAGVHQGRLQPGLLPRHVARQGRLPPLAVRLRPGRRLLPAHARADWPAHQPGAARGEPDRAERPGRGAAHRRRALRHQQRALPDPGGLAHRRRAE